MTGWRTEIPTYYGAHGRPKKLWGSATQYVCIECGDQAGEWAYDGTDPEELHEDIKGVWPVRYSAFPEFYAPLCTGCHRLQDRSAWAERRTLCTNGHEMTEENTYTRPSRPGTRECKTCKSNESRARYLRNKEKT